MKERFKIGFVWGIVVSPVFNVLIYLLIRYLMKFENF